MPYAAEVVKLDESSSSSEELDLFISQDQQPQAVQQSLETSKPQDEIVISES